MPNPFEKRATEYLRDDEAFLAIVTPEPVTRFVQKPATEERLYDRLTMIIGTPGSGKTTLARMFEFTTLKDPVAQSEYRKLQAANRYPDYVRGDAQRASTARGWAGYHWRPSIGSLENCPTPKMSRHAS